MDNNAQNSLAVQPDNTPLLPSGMSIFPLVSEWKAISYMAKTAFSSGLLPRTVKTVEAAITIALKGRELAIPPFQAWSHIHIIEGKPTMSGEIMLAMIYERAPDAEIDFLEISSKACRVKVRRNTKRSWTNFAFTIQDAQNAGLLGKNNWKSYPEAMLQWRVVTKFGRAMFADILMGVSYTPEELGSETDAAGNPVEVKSEVVSTVPRGKAPVEPAKAPETAVSSSQKASEPYRPGFGPFRGMVLAEVDQGILADHVIDLEQKIHDSGKPASPGIKTFLEESHAVLNAEEPALPGQVQKPDGTFGNFREDEWGKDAPSTLGSQEPV